MFSWARVHIRATKLWRSHSSASQPGTQYTDLFANSVKPGNRAGTISKALDFLEKWGFDG